jgi:hypothetical protein
MTDDQASPDPSWLKIGAIGCAAAIALVVLALGGIVAVTFRSYERGLAGETELDRTYGRYDSYRIPPDGAVAPDRMRRFIGVRRVLAPRCGEVSDLTDSFRRVQSAAKESGPDVMGLFSRIAGALRRMPRMGVAFGAYVADRNKALLDHGMGLGEYTWIYVVTYFALLEQPPATLLPSSNRPGLFQDRIYPQMARLIEGHIEDTGMTTGPWVEELARLRKDRERVPFSGNLPPELAASLEPHRLAVAGVACPAAAELDVTITVRRGAIGYDHR